MSNKTNITPNHVYASDGVKGQSLDEILDKYVWSEEEKEHIRKLMAVHRSQKGAYSIFGDAEEAIKDNAKDFGYIKLESNQSVVTNECGKTPRELLELVRELRSIMRDQYHTHKDKAPAWVIQNLEGRVLDALEKTKNL